MSETCVCPCIIRAGGLHGRKGSYRSRLARPEEGLYLRPVLFFRVWYRRKPTIPKPRVSCYGPTLIKTDTMLHCITPTSGRCGRVCRHPSPSRQLGSGTPRSCERALLQEIFSSGKPRPLHPSRFIFLTLPTEIQHRNKNSINVKLTKTGTGCLRCTPPCSGVRRQVAERVSLHAIAVAARGTARANTRPTAELRAGAVC